MIASATELVAWIQANLPALDEDRYEPWHAGPPAPGALSVRVRVRIQVPGRPDAVTTITLTATPLDDPY